MKQQLRGTRRGIALAELALIIMGVFVLLLVISYAYTKLNGSASMFYSALGFDKDCEDLGQERSVIVENLQKSIDEKNLERALARYGDYKGCFGENKDLQSKVQSLVKTKLSESFFTDFPTSKILYKKYIAQFPDDTSFINDIRNKVATQLQDLSISSRDDLLRVRDLYLFATELNGGNAQNEWRQKVQNGILQQYLDTSFVLSWAANVQSSLRSLNPNSAASLITMQTKESKYELVTSSLLQLDSIVEFNGQLKQFQSEGYAIVPLVKNETLVPYVVTLLHSRPVNMRTLNDLVSDLNKPNQQGVWKISSSEMAYQTDLFNLAIALRLCDEARTSALQLWNENSASALQTECGKYSTILKEVKESKSPAFNKQEFDRIRGTVS